jgi:hypothetical protein
MGLEDELVHWYKSDDGANHKSTLRLETDDPTVASGYPRDGTVTLRLMNGIGTLGFKLNPDEALRVGTMLLTLGKELVVKKRTLWQQHEE